MIRRLTREEFDRRYWKSEGPDKVPASIRREFYADYKESGLSFAAYVRQTTTQANPRRRRNGREVAQTILHQVGGMGRLVAMLGAKDFLAYPNGVAFKFAVAGAGKPNYVKILLEPSDTYSVEFGRLRGRDYKVIKAFDGVYADSLRRLFESTTGLYLSL
jgi:hypothetical protein